ncbi:2-succinyl-6-hydroxy-2,4-cyclohexadiene-1-carboxylate synthase [Neobacillus cucumis]|uniref:Putative 2-succinyl-6-hydroxy-2,4-cyclohexadiene-1-carboxylate synthase n=1 Tax=Neobacillus cucumis TaxID=1740721 RepID=A0A2N5H8Y6_9BACI|nr:2-succinyl-6-hydroxy-2,4-cyclohexadiene-1-carboxylate synthase [Neobacillus cucumis]PLS01978.1 2-succinyl-6-hydroxy-2,4-cyclohexadiene-1-carboxylate synthase [Neobacillus cucumis]
MIVVIDGIRYHVKICGDGIPLVLLHGFTGDASTWSSFFEEWSRHSRLIVPDIIGHGKSDSPEELKHYQIESMADSLNIILDQIGVNQIDLLGYSMGGRLALTFALLYPNRVRRLILESTSPGLQTESERELRCMNDAKLAKFIIDKGMTSFVDYWENIPLFFSMKKLPASVQKKIREQRLSNSPQGLSNSLLGMGTGSQPSCWDRLDQLNSDVLILTGQEDLKFCQIAEKMVLRLKKVKWMVVKNCGHAIHVEEPEKFGTIVSDFLSTEE